MNNNNKKYQSKSPIILKSGSTDLRRQEKSLIELVNNNYPDGIVRNTLYAFSNKKNTTLKIVKVNYDNSTIMIKFKREEPFSWIEYKEKGTEGYTVELRGKEKEQFLEDIGLPENL